MHNHLVDALRMGRSRNVSTADSVLFQKLISETIPSSNSVRIAAAFALASMAEIFPREATAKASFTVGIKLFDPNCPMPVRSTLRRRLVLGSGIRFRLLVVLSFGHAEK
jgi:hypothetical protein